MNGQQFEQSECEPNARPKKRAQHLPHQNHGANGYPRMRKELDIRGFGMP
jgi:hypothetical protein